MADVIAMPPVILKKPCLGSPCNGCGHCCQVELCKIGEMAFPETPAPCPGLLYRDGRYWCDVVISEQRAFDTGELTTPPILAEMLGIGRGCDAETEEEIEGRRGYGI